MAPGKYRIVVLALALTASAFSCAGTGADKTSRASPGDAEPEPEKAQLQAPLRVERTGEIMGTSLQIIVVSIDRSRAEKAIDDAIAEMRRLQALMTSYEDHSEVAAVNRSAGVRPAVVSKETYDVVSRSLEISRLTGGAFDITFAGAGRFWDFKRANPAPPDPGLIARRVALIDYRRVALNKAERSVFLEKPDMRLGLGGIAKGYIIDAAARLLSQRGFRNFIVNAGGDVRLRGRNETDALWRVGIKDPRRPERNFALLSLTGGAIVTSGDYERFFMYQGKRYHHIIDPRTGYPAGGCRSVTIVSPECMTSDALATGVFVMGPEKGMALIESVPGLEGVIIGANGEVFVSTGLKKGFAAAKNAATRAEAVK